MRQVRQYLRRDVALADADREAANRIVLVTTSPPPFDSPQTKMIDQFSKYFMQNSPNSSNVGRIRRQCHVIELMQFDHEIPAGFS